MDHPQRAFAIDCSNRQWSRACTERSRSVNHRLKHNSLWRGGTQRNIRGGILICHPIIFFVREMGFVVGEQKLKILIDDLSRQRAEAFAFLEWQLEHRAAQMLKQNQQMIWVDQRLLRRAIEEIFGMMGEELIQGTRRRKHHCRGRFKSAPCATRLLPRGSDSPWIADEDRR